MSEQPDETTARGAATFIVATPDGPLVVEFTITISDLDPEDPRQPGDIMVTGWPGKEGWITQLDIARQALLGAS